MLLGFVIDGESGGHGATLINLSLKQEEPNSALIVVARLALESEDADPEAASLTPGARLDDIGAVMKLMANTTAGPPGPMVGLHGYMRPNLKPDPALQREFDAKLAALEAVLPSLASTIRGLPRTLEGFAFGLVDLTDDPRLPGFGRSQPAYAGTRDTASRPFASLVKLLPLYAAHQLRSDARALASVSAPSTIRDVALLLRSHHRRMGAADDVYPLVEDMFELDALGVVQFRRGGTLWPTTTGVVETFQLNQLNAEEHPRTPAPTPTPARKAAIAGKLGSSVAPTTKLAALRDEFRRVELQEQLRLMAGWSNNISATLVTHAIGFPYLWVLAKRSGLYRPRGWERLTTTGAPGPLEHPGGMFLGQDYEGNIWRDRPRGAPVAGKDSSQAANVRSVAQLLTSMAHELIDDEAHISMREMLRKRDDFTPLLYRGEYSPIGRGMADATPISTGGAFWRPAQALWDYNAVPAELSTARDELTNGDLAVSKIGVLPLAGLKVSANAVLLRAFRRQSGAQPMPVTAVLVAVGQSATLPPNLLAEVLRLFGTTMGDLLDARHP